MFQQTNLWYSNIYASYQGVLNNYCNFRVVIINDILDIFYKSNVIYKHL